jgi:hypothetical protein
MTTPENSRRTAEVMALAAELNIWVERRGKAGT